MQFVVTFFRSGGTMMFINLAVLVVTLAVIAERAYSLNFRFRMNTKAFLAEIDKAIGAGNLQKAKKLCKDNHERVLARVVFAALNAASLGPDGMRNAIDESKAEVVPQFTKRINLLWPIANIATLIGLVGTVFGLIEAFSAVGAVSAEQKAALLTAGISHAMNNTAFGLMIALVCMVAHLLLANVTKSISEDVEFASLRMENLLIRMMAERARGGAATGSTEGQA